MSIVGVICGLLLFAITLGFGWILADILMPQSEIDKVEAIGRWAKEELERREAERQEE